MRRYCISLCLILLVFFGHGQTKRQSLEKQKSALKSDIAYKNKLLKETSKSKSSSLNQLYLLRKKIKNRESLLQTIRNEIGIIGDEMKNVKDSIVILQENLEALKEEYAKMVYNAYLNRSAQDRIMFIFASKDFNQAYKRMKYLQQYSDYRVKQGELIQATKDTLNMKNQALERKKEEKLTLIENIEVEKKILDGERSDQQQVFNALNSKEKALKDEIKKKEKEAQRLTRAIRRIIEEEIRKQRAAKGGKGGFVLTPEAKALSDKFASNRGKLPWPLEKGVITEYYGEHWHPVLKGIKVKNNGLNIATEEGGKARAVFSGEVTGVMVIPGMGKALMIRHGEYISVYSNLKDVFVQKGDKVETKDPIGVIMTDESKGKTEIHFEVWKGQTTMNPVQWLYGAR